MPRAFDITPSAPKVKMNSGETAEVAFTVSNKLPRSIRTRAYARPDGDTDGGWLYIPPEKAEPELGTDETKLITVQVKLPAKLKDGTYPFHIVVSSLAEPDEIYAESAPVPIVVRHVEIKPFPWWIVVLGVGVVVVAGGAFGLAKVLGKHKNVAVGTNCTADANCGADQKCVEFRPGAKSCLLKPEQKCTTDLQCASAYCRRDDHLCARDDGQCTAQTAAKDCRPGTFECVGNHCLLSTGQKCQDHPDCATDFCQGGVCTACTAVCTGWLRCHRNQCEIISFPFPTKPLEPMRRFQGTHW